jgi:hypothetical protein
MDVRMKISSFNVAGTTASLDQSEAPNSLYESDVPSTRASVYPNGAPESFGRVAIESVWPTQVGNVAR